MNFFDDHSLIIKKLLVAFCIGAFPLVATGLTGLADSIVEGQRDWGAVSTIMLGILCGALGAGLRLALAQFTSWLPTDELHGRGSTPETVVVSPRS